MEMSSSNPPFSLKMNNKNGKQVLESLVKVFMWHIHFTNQEGVIASDPDACLKNEESHDKL